MGLVVEIFAGRDPHAPRASDEFEAWAAETATALDAVRWFYTTVAGVSFPNDDGSDRQALLRATEPEQMLELVPEPTNPFHNQAVKVMSPAGQLGYLDRRCAQEVSNKMTRGARFAAAFCETREAGHRPGADHLHGAVIAVFELGNSAA